MKTSPRQVDRVMNSTNVGRDCWPHLRQLPHGWRSMSYTYRAHSLPHVCRPRSSDFITWICCGFVVQLDPSVVLQFTRFRLYSERVARSVCRASWVKNGHVCHDVGRRLENSMYWTVLRESRRRVLTGCLSISQHVTGEFLSCFFPQNSASARRASINQWLPHETAKFNLAASRSESCLLDISVIWTLLA